MDSLSLPLFGEEQSENVPAPPLDRPAPQPKSETLTKSETLPRSEKLTLEKLASQLNDRQLAAVVSGDQYLLILAGAGSGKTRVITYKIAWLIEGGVSPYRILALTFTNKAAKEMRERAESLGSVPAGRGLWISTFHSACLRILRRYHEKIGYPKDFNVLDQADQERLLKHCIKLLGLEEKENPVRQVASRISKFKNEMKGAEEASAELHPIRDENFLNIFAIYQQKLVETRNMDFDDLLGKTVELLRREQDVRLEYNNRFAHIMVDEFQDTNAVQYELITLLAGKETGITVVGDDDQSIYRWRGADVGNFARFERGHPKIGVVKLEQNYRSTKNILKAAHNVVSQNSGRKEKELWTQKSGGEKVRLTTTLDEIDEASEIARTINKLVKIESVRLGDIAVFYRTNAQSRALEDVLRREGYPYQIFGGLKFYARAEIKDLLAYFRTVMNPHDAVIAFRRCINRPPRGIGDVTVGRLIQSAEENGRTPLGMLDYLDDVAGLNAGAIKKLEAVREIFREIGGLLHNKNPAEAISSALLITGYRQFLEEDKESRSLGRIENLDELVSAAIDYESSTGDSSMLGFLDQATLVADADEVDNETGAVKLMTVHISKGLEFPVVFVAGLEDKLFPHARSIDDPAMMAEERRLLYVAMTRAKERLYLSNAVNRRIFGVTTPCKPSQFLFDIPEDILDIRKSSGLTEQKSIYAGQSRKSFTTADRAKVFGKKSLVSTSKTSDGIGVGDKVSHGRFGTGVVRDISGQGDKSKVTVYFTRYGEKKLIWKFAKLSKV